MIDLVDFSDSTLVTILDTPKIRLRRRVTEGWSYRKSITLSTGTQYNAGLTEYVVRFKVYYGVGNDDPNNYIIYLNEHGKTDFSDVRFTTLDGLVLPYWIESKVDGNYAVFWVTIPVESSTTTIYIYYGNSEAVYEGDPNEVFIFFDDFTVLSDNWLVTGVCRSSTVPNLASVYVSNGWLRMEGWNSCAGVYYGLGIPTPTVGIAVETYVNISSYPYNADWFILFLTSSKDNAHNYRDVRARTGAVSWDNHYWYLWTHSGDAVAGLLVSEGNHRVSFHVSVNKQKLVVNDTVLLSTQYNVNIPTPLYLVLLHGGVSLNYINYGVDWVGIRAYVEPEPTISSIGSEESVLPPTGFVDGVLVSLTDNYVVTVGVPNEFIDGVNVGITDSYNITVSEVVGVEFRDGVVIVISDSYGITVFKPLSNALVEVYDESNKLVVSGYTDSRGRVSFFIPIGKYRVRVSKESYETMEFIDVLSESKTRKVYLRRSG